MRHLDDCSALFIGLYRQRNDLLNFPYLVLNKVNKDIYVWDTILHIVEHKKMLLIKEHE